MILKLSEEVNDKNYYDIIIFLQKYKFDSNNLKIDEIINEREETKKEILIKNLQLISVPQVMKPSYFLYLIVINIFE